MRVKPIASAGVLLVAASVPFVTTAGADSENGPIRLGGYTARVVAAPLAIRVYEPVIPLPAEPQGELDVGFTQAATSFGPIHRATASTIWPGAAVGDGFGLITDSVGLGHHDYPVMADATYPTGHGEREQSLGVARMTARAGERFATASATGGPDVDLPPAVGQAMQVRSSSTTTLEERGIAAQAAASAQDLTIAGVLRLRSVDARATASSTGEKAGAEGRSVYAGLELGGAQLTVDDKGVHAGGQTVNWPGLPADPNQALKELGITITSGKSTKNVSGASATYTSFALRVTVDTLVLRKRIEPLGYRELYNQLWGEVLKALPAEIRREIESRVPSLVDLGPLVVYDIGYVSVSAAASPEWAPLPVPTFEPPPTDPVPVPTTPPFDGGVGTLPPVPPVDPPVAGQPQPPVVGPQPRPVTLVGAPAPFGGLTPATMALALLAATFAALGLRRLAVLTGIMPGSDDGCRLGADVGVPDLRDEG